MYSNSLGSPNGPRTTRRTLNQPSSTIYRHSSSELGTGFCFEAKQKRITVANEHDYIDLVFYHRILRCHVLLDLKVRPFNHGDAGQMNFYLNYFKRRVMGVDDSPLLASSSAATEIKLKSSLPPRASTISSLSRATWSRYRRPRNSENSSSATVRLSRAACAKPTARNLTRDSSEFDIFPV
jgi:nuclease YhcG-like protein